jgi:hypothetical protein
MDSENADYVEIAGVHVPRPPDRIDCNSTSRGRPWVGIRFDCCNVYTRVYRNADGTAYLGRCPRCLKKVRLNVGAGGTDARFFVAE